MEITLSASREQNPLTTSGNKPSLDDMRWWKDSLNNLWQEAAEDEGSLSDQMRWDEDLYFQHFNIEAPQGKHVVRTGSAPSDADAAMDSLTPTDIQVRVRPARNRQNHKDRADKLAKFGRALVALWRKGKDPFRLITSDQVIRHVGVTRVLYDDRHWPQVPKGEPDSEEWIIAHRKKFPILMEVRNPQYVRWRQLDDGTLLAVVEYFQTTIAEAKLTFSDYPTAWGILAGRQPNDRVWIADVWVGKHRCVMIEEKPIFADGDDGVVEHGYPEPPYVVIPFRELHFEAVSRRYRGMLSNASGLYEIESQVLTMHVWQLAWNSWRTWVGHFMDPSRKVDITPGSVIDINKTAGEYLEMLAGEPVPPELLGTAAMIDSYIQRNGVAQGPRTQEGTRSAQQVWAIQSIRQIKVEPAKQELQRGVERMLTLAAKIILARMPGEKITLPVPGRDQEGNPIGEVTITSADLEGYEESFDVTFGRRLDPALLEQAKAVMGLALNQWMPLKTSWELSGLTDSPDEWEDLLTMQKVEQLDFMQEILGYENLVATYGQDSWQVQYYQQRMQNPPPQQGRRRGGMPGMPQGPIQPNALPTGPQAPAPSPGQMMAGQGMQQASRANGRMAPTAPTGVTQGGAPGTTAPGGP